MTWNVQCVTNPGNVSVLRNVNTLRVCHCAFHDYMNVQCVQNLKKLVYPQVMNKYERFCVDEAQYHLNRAQELLTEGLRDPKRYYNEGQEFYRMLAKMFPFIVLLQQYNAPQPHDSDEEDSLSSTQSSVPSDEDSFEPVTQPAR
jgi:hypothetical protein